MDLYKEKYKDFDISSSLIESAKNYFGCRDIEELKKEPYLTGFIDYMTFSQVADRFTVREYEHACLYITNRQIRFSDKKSAVRFMESLGRECRNH